MEIIVQNESEIEQQVIPSLLHFKEGVHFYIFEGEMGTGKTTTIKSFCRYLGVKDNVSSPTFSLVNEYSTTQNETIYHFDFYRIKDIEEAFDIGYEEYFYSPAYCFVEWAEKIEPLLPETYIKVHIEVQTDQSRKYQIRLISN